MTNFENNENKPSKLADVSGGYADKTQKEKDIMFLQIAVDVAVNNVKNLNGGPFGAVLVAQDGQIFVTGNTVTNDNDPTAHAEVNVIRQACKALGTFDLTGATLYSSCEPCPMCLGASMWARVDRVLFSADRFDAAKGGFDDAEFYIRIDRGEGKEHVRVDSYNEPFEVWLQKDSRIEY